MEEVFDFVLEVADLNESMATDTDPIPSEEKTT